jgi:hypothetical protein
MAGPAPSRVFTITELQRTGQGQLVATPVVFRWPSSSHAAPHDAIEIPLQVKTVRSENPGSDEVTEQVLAATWQPFDVQGEWNDQYGGAGFAMGTYRDFGRLVARASLVRIEIEQLSVVGLITNFTPRYERETVVGYKFTFSPHQHETVGNQRTIGPATQVATRPLSAHLTDAKNAVAALDDSTQAAVVMPRATALDTIKSGLDKVLVLQSIIARLERTLSEGLGADAVRKLTAIAAQFRALLQGALDLAKHYEGSRGADDDSTGHPVAALRLSEHARTAQAQARVLASKSLAAERDALARARTKPRAIHRPFAGESLYRISQRYYGTPDEWRTIYNANHLRTLVLAGTEELIIPDKAV